MTDPAGHSMRDAARRVLDRDGHDHALQRWQVAYLVALTEGRDGPVPPGCGAGKGWLDARLREALADAGATGDDPSGGG